MTKIGEGRRYRAQEVDETDIKGPENRENFLIAWMARDKVEGKS